MFQNISVLKIITSMWDKYIFYKMVNGKLEFCRLCSFILVFSLEKNLATLEAAIQAKKFAMSLSSTWSLVSSHMNKPFVESWLFHVAAHLQLDLCRACSSSPLSDVQNVRVEEGHQKRQKEAHWSCKWRRYFFKALIVIYRWLLFVSLSLLSSLF